MSVMHRKGSGRHYPRQLVGTLNGVPWTGMAACSQPDLHLAVPLIIHVSDVTFLGGPSSSPQESFVLPRSHYQVGHSPYFIITIFCGTFIILSTCSLCSLQLASHSNGKQDPVSPCIPSAEHCAWSMLGGQYISVK